MATNKNEVNICKKCGSVVEAVKSAGGTLSCCGEHMHKLEENTVEASKEKHIPVIEKIEGGYKVVVGSVAHPMEDKHWIEWIELVAEDEDAIYRKNLKPGDKPEAIFYTKAEKVYAREHCNLHGHWKA